MRIPVVILFLSLVFGSLQAQNPKLTFTPHWLPQAQFAGYYVAQQKGFYQAEGLDVEIVHPSASVMATDRLRTGESDVVSLFLVTALSARTPDFQLVNIGQVSQNSALLFVMKKDSEIQNLADLDGKRIGIWESGFEEVPMALVQSNNIHVNWVPILSSVNLFLIGGLDAMTVMWYNEYDQIINSGINPDELNTLFFSDYGYNIPEDGMYCLSETLQKRPEDLQKFVNGTLKGWEYARTHREETLQIVLRLMKQAHIATNLAHQQWMLDKVLELQEPGEKNVRKGELAESDFYKTQNLLLEGGFMKQKVPFKSFFQARIGR